MATLVYCLLYLTIMQHPHYCFSMADLFIVRGKNRGIIDEIKAFTNLANGKILNLPFVEYFKTKKFYLQPLDPNDDSFYSIDGELMKAHPIMVEVQPSMGRFVY